MKSYQFFVDRLRDARELRNSVPAGMVAAPRNGSVAVARPNTRKPARIPAAPDLFTSALDTQQIYCGDNLDVLRRMPAGCVDLIYIDPPFNSNRVYETFWGEKKEKRGFEDRHESTRAYIEYMRPRCVELARVLKKTGSFYYHCGWQASHYAKVMLDVIFGENQFRNEIVWKRSSAHSDTKQGMSQYGRVCESIFFYTKGNRWTWNPQYQPYSDEYRKRFSGIDPDGRRWKSENLTAAKAGGDTDFEWHGCRPPKGRYWAYSRVNLDRLHAEGRIHFTRSGFPRLKQYLNELPGVSLQNLWTDIPPVNSQANDRVGYPTQKPIPLLERIIKASSNPGDVVLDAFCGCGTALVAAQQLERRWVGIDISPTACRVMAGRLKKDCGLREGRDFWVNDLPRDESELRRMPHFEFENWAVNALGGIPNKTKTGDMGIDGRVFPVRAITPDVRKKPDQFDFMDDWYPVQVKQKDKVGRPDIDAFEAVMHRENRVKGFFVSFDFTDGALTEIGAFFRKSGKVIVPLTVREILDEEIARKLV